MTGPSRWGNLPAFGARLRAAWGALLFALTPRGGEGKVACPAGKLGHGLYKERIVKNVRNIADLERLTRRRAYWLAAAVASVTLALALNFWQGVAGDSPGAVAFLVITVILLCLAFLRIDDGDILMRAEELLYKEQRGKTPSSADLERTKSALEAASGRLKDLRAVAANTPDGEATMADALASAEKEEERCRLEHERLRDLDREGEEMVKTELARIRLALEARKNGGDGSLTSAVPTVARQLRVAAIAETLDVDDFFALAEAEAERAAEEEFPSARAARP